MTVKIFIDPGHGGTDPGAVGNGLREKDLALTIAKRIETLLNDYQGVQVKLSRTNDKTLSLKQRTDAANAWKADYLMSVHINAAGGTGFESFTYNGSYGGKAATNQKRNVIHDEIVKATGLRDRGKKEANFHMVRASAMQSVLTECGFIDNANDAKLLKQASFINKIAQGHVNGVVKAFNLKKKVASKPSPTPPKKDDKPVSNKPSAWEKEAKEAVEEMKELGITDGTRLDDTITRREAIVMINRARKLK